jgi:hypothetical protein
VIKVLINGTPIYKLCFARRRYSSVKRKGVGLHKLIQAVKNTNHYEEGDWEAVNANVIETLKKAFAGRPLYETTAIVYLIDAKKDEPPVATATVRQCPLDPHSPEDGRQKALDKLLRVNPVGTEHDLEPTFSKVERTAIRAAYMNRPRIQSTPPKGQPPAAAGGSVPAQVASPTVPPAPKDAGRPGVKATPNTHPVVSKVVPIARPWFQTPSTAVH